MSSFRKYLPTFILGSLAGVIYYLVVFPPLFWVYDVVTCKLRSGADCDASFTLDAMIGSYPTRASDIAILVLIFLPPAILSFGVTAVGIKENRAAHKSIQTVVLFFGLVTVLFHVIPLVLLSGDEAFWRLP
jgi:hypothetical protein